jgi:hypothetical protein
MMMSPPTSNPRSNNGDNTNSDQTQNRAARPASAHLAAAAEIDERLAIEARANLRRFRTAQREQAIKAESRITVPLARIVAKPAPAAGWKAPFLSLAMVVGISTMISAGGIAYLTLRPTVIANASDAELRSIRETVTQLRRQVAELSLIAANNRTPASQPSFERVAQPRETSVPIAASVPSARDRMAHQPDSAAPEITGSVNPPAAANAARQLFDGWQIRRVYDDAAVLESKSGVIEVTLGQDVPVLGRIQDIKQDSGRWQVVTSKGIIIGR